MAIRGYQRYLSPRKGFCCAYRVHTGRGSCSALGYRAVRRYGALVGLAVLRRRLYLCGVAFRRYSAAPGRAALRTQQGFCDCAVPCDLPCDGSCHLPGGSACSTAGDFLSCCDCGSCDWPDRKRKNKEEERTVHIPPHPSTRKEDPR